MVRKPDMGLTLEDSHCGSNVRPNPRSTVKNRLSQSYLLISMPGPGNRERLLPMVEGSPGHACSGGKS